MSDQKCHRGVSIICHHCLFIKGTLHSGFSNNVMLFFVYEKCETAPPPLHYGVVYSSYESLYYVIKCLQHPAMILSGGTFEVVSFFFSIFLKKKILLWCPTQPCCYSFGGRFLSQMVLHSNLRDWSCKWWAESKLVLHYIILIFFNSSCFHV